MSIETASPRVLMAQGTKSIMRPGCAWWDDTSLAVSIRGPTVTIVMGSAQARDENMPVSMMVTIMEGRCRMPRRPRKQHLKGGHAPINNPHSGSNVGAIACQPTAAAGMHKNTLTQFHTFLC